MKIELTPIGFVRTEAGHISHRKEYLGVFSICSQVRPNPIGMSVVEVTAIEGIFLTPQEQ